MQNVSDEFKEAILASTRQFVPQVKIWFADNRIRGGDISVTADELDSTLFPKRSLVDGRLGVVKKWALAREDCYPSDDLYPIDAGWEGGWFGNVLSDANGYLDPPVVILFTATESIYATLLEIFGDAWLGYPVDFAWYCWTGSAWRELVNVIGNDDPYWSYEINIHDFFTDQWKLVISRISRAYDYPAMVEVQASISMDVSRDVLAFEIDRGCYYRQRGTTPLGNAAAGELHLTLENISGRYERYSPSSVCWSNIKPNQKIEIKMGLVLPDKSVEYCSLGTFYSTIWQFDYRNGRVTVRALDRSRELLRRYYYSTVLENYSIGELAQELLQGCGLLLDEYQIDAQEYVVPYAWFGARNAWEELQTLAAGAGGIIYFNENGILVFKDKDHALGSSSVLTIEDSHITDAKDIVDEAHICNVVYVESTRYTESTIEKVWELHDVLTVPASGTLTVLIKFNDVVIDANAPQITDSGPHISVRSYVYTAQNGTIVLENNGTEDEVVTGMYITGKRLIGTSSTMAEARNSASIQNYGYLAWKISNPYIQSHEQAYRFACFLLDTYSDPGQEIIVSMDSRGLPHLELGDRITVHISKPLLWCDYWLVHHRLRYDGSLSSELTLLRTPQ